MMIVATQYGWNRSNIKRCLNLLVKPYGPLRFGWIEKVIPMDPTLVSCKRTALGSLKHECA